MPRSTPRPCGRSSGIRLVAVSSAGQDGPLRRDAGTRATSQRSAAAWFLATPTANAHDYNGYPRVSTTAQYLDAQVEALTGAGGVGKSDSIVERPFGRCEDRPEFAPLLVGLNERVRSSPRGSTGSDGPPPSSHP